MLIPSITVSTKSVIFSLVLIVEVLLEFQIQGQCESPKFWNYICWLIQGKIKLFLHITFRYYSYVIHEINFLPLKTVSGLRIFLEMDNDHSMSETNQLRYKQCITNMSLVRHDNSWNPFHAQTHCNWNAFYNSCQHFLYNESH